MPGFITHIAFANRYLKKNPTRDFQNFILGTTFPDIRYFAKIDRNLTHKKFKTELNLSRLDSFNAGWKLHIYLDHQWNKLIRSSKLYEKYKSDLRVAGVAVKIIEDGLDVKKINNLPKIIEALRSPGFGTVLHIPKERIKFYYSMSVDYLVTKNQHNYIKFIFRPDMVKKINQKIDEIKKDKESMKFLSGILNKLSP